jgi:hypothetical protein
MRDGTERTAAADAAAKEEATAAAAEEARWAEPLPEEWREAGKPRRSPVGGAEMQQLIRGSESPSRWLACGQVSGRYSET